MKPPIPIAVALHLALASASLHAGEPAHALQPNAPRTIVVSEAQTPPVIRAGLLQSTLIVLPSEEKVANVFAGDTVDWVFDGGHIASRFISVKPRTAGSTTDIHIVSDHGNEYTLQLREISGDDDAHYDSKILIEPGDKDFDYTWDKSKGKELGLQEIWRDDKFTYLRGKSQETPALYEVKDKKPSLINFDFNDGLYTVPKQLDNGYLEIGKQKVDFHRTEEAR
jgi:type IV secretion system protein VirB9